MSHRNHDQITPESLEEMSSKDPKIEAILKNVEDVVAQMPKESTADKPIELEMIGTLPEGGGIEIWSVDGTEIRKRLDNDFLLGDNWLAPPHIVPKGHIWVERILDPIERNFILIHEVVEVMLMAELGYSYPKAHKIASAVELHYRKRLS